MFLGYIHSFRALAILFIVGGHSIDFFSWQTEDESIERFLRILISNGSVLFVFIAGYLFQHLSAKYDAKKYFKGKLNNVLIPYFLVSIPAILVFVFVMQRDAVWPGFYDNAQWLQVVYFYLTGLHLAPLWFIPMITLFYLISPLLVIADKYKAFYWSLPAFILLSCFVSRGMPAQSFIHFFSVYLLGMYCSHYKISVNKLLKQSSVLMVLALFVVSAIYYEFYFMNGTMTYVNYLQKIVLSLFFLGALIRLGNKIDSKLIYTIADTSFGVFFIHSYVLTGSKMIYAKTFGDKMSGDILLYPIITLLVLLACTGIIVLLQKSLGKKSRYLVGS